MGELGRYPIKIDVFCETVKYFERLISDDVSNLLKGALKENGYLHEHKKRIGFLACTFFMNFQMISWLMLQSQNL